MSARLEREQLQNITSRCACLKTRALGAGVIRLYDAEFNGGPINALQFLALITIHLNPHNSISGIAGILNVTRSTVSRTLKLLMENGHLAYAPGKTSNRVRAAYLTPKGTQSVLRGIPLWQNAQAKIESAWKKRGGVPQDFADLMDKIQVLTVVAGENYE